MIGHTKSQRQGVQSTQPAEIHLCNGDTITAPDIDRDDGWVIVYRRATTGIDKMIPREAILFIDRDNDRGTPSNRGENNETSRVASVNDDEYDSEDSRPMADGGQVTDGVGIRTCRRCGRETEWLQASLCAACHHSQDSLDIIENADADPGDVVEYFGGRDEFRGTPWIFDSYGPHHIARLTDRAGGTVTRVDVRTLQPTDADEDAVPLSPFAAYAVADHHSNTHTQFITYDNDAWGGGE